MLDSSWRCGWRPVLSGLGADCPARQGAAEPRRDGWGAYLFAVDRAGDGIAREGGRERQEEARRRATVLERHLAEEQTATGREQSKRDAGMRRSAASPTGGLPGCRPRVASGLSGLRWGHGHLPVLSDCVPLGFLAEFHFGQCFKIGIEIKDVGGMNPKRISIRMAERPAKELKRAVLFVHEQENGRTLHHMLACTTPLRHWPGEPREIQLG